jgi:hypothetical protein
LATNPSRIFGQLPGQPFGRRVSRHSQPQDLAPAMTQNQQAAKKSKGNRWNDKKIQRGNPTGMIAQKSLPAL